MNEELKVIISAEIGKLKDQTNKAKQEINGFKEQVNKAKADTEKNFKDIGEKIGNGLKTAATVGAAAVASIAAALVGASAATADYRKNQAQLTAAFEQAQLSAASATGVYRELYGVIGDDDQAVESAANIALLAQSEKEAAEWADLAAGIVGTFHDTLQPEAFYEAANETLKLNEATGAFAQMLEQTGVMSVDEFNDKLAACTTEAEKQALMLGVTQNAVGAAGESYKESAADIIAQNEAQAKLTDNLAKLGEAVAPIITLFTNFANAALAKVTPYIQELAEKYGPTLKAVLEGVGQAVSSTFSFITENWELVLSIAGVIGGIVAAIGLYNTVAAIKAAMDAAQVTTVWGLVSAHIAQAAAAMVAIAPYLLIVAAIAAVIAIIVLCIEYWDEIVAAVKAAVQAVADAISAAWDWIVNLFSSIGGWIYDNVIAPVVQFFSDLWNGVKDGAAALWEGIKNIFSAVANWFYDTLIKPVKDFFTGMWDGLKNGAKNAWQGIKNVFSAVANFFGDIFKNAWEKVKKVFSVGGKIFDGIKDGIVKAFKFVVNGIIKGINKVVALPFKGLNGILDTLSGLSILGVEPFGWLTWRCPIPQIPELEKGGVLKRGQIGLLEGNGAEAVVPLEKNTEWITKVAEMLGGRMGGTNRPIYLMLDKKVLAEGTVEGINDITRLTGNLPLVLA